MVWTSQGPASAHEFSPFFVWWTAGVTPTVEDRSTSFPATIFGATADYNSTDLTVNGPCSWYCGNIAFTEYNYGDTQWNGAMAQPYAYYGGWIACVNFNTGNLTGDCDTNNKKSQYAYVHLNTFDWSILTTYSNNLFRHELGHVFGFKHWCVYGGPSADRSSVLNACVSPRPDVLQQHDRNDINLYY